MEQRYEYRVVQLREGLVGGKLSGGKLEEILNEHAFERARRLTALT